MQSRIPCVGDETGVWIWNPNERVKEGRLRSQHPCCSRVERQGGSDGGVLARTVAQYLKNMSGGIEVKR